MLLQEFDNPREEYLAVVGELKERIEKGEDLKDTALLLRTNQEAEGLVGALMERQIPFQMKETLPNLFHHWILPESYGLYASCQGRQPTPEFP